MTDDMPTIALALPQDAVLTTNGSGSGPVSVALLLEEEVIGFRELCHKNASHTKDGRLRGMSLSELNLLGLRPRQ